MNGLSELKKELEAGKVRGLYLIYGHDSHGKQEALSLIREKVLMQGFEMFNENTFEKPFARTFIEAADTLPVMGGKRLIVVRDYEPLKPKSPSASEETDAGQTPAPAEEPKPEEGAEEGAEEWELPPDDADRVIEWTARLPEDSAVVFYQSGDTGKATKLFKTLDGLGGFEIGLGSKDEKKSKDESVQRDARELRAMLETALARAGKQIDPAALEYLIENSASPHEDLQRVIDFCADRARIARQDVTACLDEADNTRLFAVFDSFIDGKHAAGFKALRSVLNGGVPYEAVLPAFVRSMRTIVQVSLMAEKGKSPDAIAGAMKIHPYVAKLSAGRSRGVPSREVIGLYSRFVELITLQRQGRISAEDSVYRAIDAIGGYLQKKNAKTGTRA